MSARSAYYSELESGQLVMVVEPTIAPPMFGLVVKNAVDTTCPFSGQTRGLMRRVVIALPVRAHVWTDRADALCPSGGWAFYVLS